MSRAHLGQSAAAAEALADGRAIFERQPPMLDPATAANWHDWLICKSLLQEAESVVER